MLKVVFVIMIGCVVGCVSTGTTQKVDPRRALDTRVQLGMQYLEAENRDQALRQFVEVLNIDSRQPEALKGLAIIHQMNGEMEEAEAAFKKGIRHADGALKPALRYRYGLFLTQQDRYTEAKVEFERVAKNLVFPQRPEALYFAGRCALELGDKVRAKAAFRHSLNLRKELAPSALELADLAFQEQDYATAKKFLDQFSAHAEASPRSLWLGIRIDRTFGHHDRVASQALALKNLFGYSKEYLQYKQLIENN